MVRGVRDRVEAVFAVSVTTRHHRPHERDGVDYHFVSDSEFDEMVAGGALLEWAEYGGHRYGTPVAEIDEATVHGSDVIMDIENDGARQVRVLLPEATLIFVLPPSLEELKQRLEARGDTSSVDVARRLAVAEEQIVEAPGLYDHLVVNEVLSTAISQVVSILTAPSTSPAGASAPSEPDDDAPRSKTTS